MEGDTQLRAVHRCALSLATPLLLLGLVGCSPYRLTADAGPPQRVCYRFGRIGVGVVAHSGFFGGVKGVSSGTGVVIDVPPLVPVISAIYLLGTVAVAVPLFIAEGSVGGDGSFAREVVGDVSAGLAESVLTPEALGHGLEFPERRYISEFSLDASYAGTWHHDRAFGGDLEYSAFLIGVRFGGPRRYVPRYYVCGGFGWFDFDYDNRPNASLPGPYVGGGLEVFPNESLSLALDWRGHFFFGDDDARARVEGGASQTSLVFSWYW